MNNKRIRVVYDHIGSSLLEISELWLDWIIQIPGWFLVNLESNLALIYSFLGENATLY